MHIRSFVNKILIGVSTGIVIALIPVALLGELMKALTGIWSLSSYVLELTVLATKMLPACIGLCVAMQFGMTSVECATVAIAAVAGSGIAVVNTSGVLFVGTGDLINTIITSVLGVGVILVVSPKVKTYQVLIIPTLVLLIAGGIGNILLPYVQKITSVIGFFLLYLTTLQPFIMCILISIIFSCVCISPVSSVGIAIAVNLVGLGSGAANLGCTAASISLGLASAKVNGAGVTVAHFLGSPKIQICNFVNKPLMALPTMVNALFLGCLAPIFNIQGTAFSAGFGISGLIGPMAALNLFKTSITYGHIMIVILSFGIVPVILAVLLNNLFIDRLKWLSYDDYKIDI